MDENHKFLDRMDTFDVLKIKIKIKGICNLNLTNPNSEKIIDIL